MVRMFWGFRAYCLRAWGFRLVLGLLGFRVVGFNLRKSGLGLRMLLGL